MSTGQGQLGTAQNLGSLNTVQKHECAFFKALEGAHYYPRNQWELWLFFVLWLSFPAPALYSSEQVAGGREWATDGERRLPQRLQDPEAMDNCVLAPHSHTYISTIRQGHGLKPQSAGNCKLQPWFTPPAKLHQRLRPPTGHFPCSRTLLGTVVQTLNGPE